MRIVIIILILNFTNQLYSQNNFPKDICINQDVKQIKYIGVDTINMYGKNYIAKKYLLVCKSKIQTKASREKAVFRKGILTYYVYVYNDSLNEIEDSLMVDIYNYLKDNKTSLRAKEIIIKDNNYLLTIGNITNNYGDYFIHWYKNTLYKFVFVKSKSFFKNDIGGFSYINLSFKGNSGFIDFYDNPDKQGIEAYEVVNANW